MSTLIVELLHHLVTLSDAAQDIGVSKVTLWRWERQGKLTTYRIEREVLIEKAEVERLRRERQ